jgi:hypothetical protein
MAVANCPLPPPAQPVDATPFCIVRLATISQVATRLRKIYGFRQAAPSLVCKGGVGRSQILINLLFSQFGINHTGKVGKVRASCAGACCRGCLAKGLPDII